MPWRSRATHESLQSRLDLLSWVVWIRFAEGEVRGDEKQQPTSAERLAYSGVVSFSDTLALTVRHRQGPMTALMLKRDQSQTGG